MERFHFPVIIKLIKINIIVDPNVMHNTASFSTNTINNTSDSVSIV